MSAVNSVSSTTNTQPAPEVAGTIANAGSSSESIFTSSSAPAPSSGWVA
ncbi:MAG: hypothetical protein IJ003_02620 [Candidatus Gastranaerophilales bacterium]|nr:hypothetical protein [Candidatus Gastranaerophilales bacterium]